MTKRVGTNRLDDAGQTGCLLDRFLQTTFVQVVAARDARTWILRQRVGWKDELPAPFPIGVRIFACQGIGHAKRTAP